MAKSVKCINFAQNQMIMLIANPLYDRAFKMLMENEKIAKLIISTIIETEVISLDMQPQEVVIQDKKRNFPILRYDFKAVIKTESEKHKVVLIEVQKSKYPDPIMRFRKYLASNYMKSQKVDGKEKALPIITIYFLGYNLPEYDTPAILVNNTVTDARSKKEIPYKNEFVELLTHPSYILQVERLPERRKTKIEKLLSLFDQAKKSTEDYLLELSDKDLKELNGFQPLAGYLNEVIQDEQTLLELELEKDIEKEFEKLEESVEKERKAKEEALKATVKERKAKEEAQKSALKERKAKEKALYKLAKMMKDLGKSNEEIINETGLTRDEIENI